MDSATAVALTWATTKVPARRKWVDAYVSGRNSSVNKMTSSTFPSSCCLFLSAIHVSYAARVLFFFFFFVLFFFHVSVVNYTSCDNCDAPPTLSCSQCRLMLCTSCSGSRIIFCIIFQSFLTRNLFKATLKYYLLQHLLLTLCKSGFFVLPRFKIPSFQKPFTRWKPCENTWLRASWRPNRACHSCVIDLTDSPKISQFFFKNKTNWRDLDFGTHRSALNEAETMLWYTIWFWKIFTIIRIVSAI